MASELIHDRGRGPELRSCRITVYDLIPYLEDSRYADGMMLDIWPITVEELSALKQYIADHNDEVMAVHRKIEKRIQRGMAAQDTPEFRERTRKTRVEMKYFQQYLAERKSLGEIDSATREEIWDGFRTWLESRATPNGAKVA